jgi:hypothetical protein
MVRGRAIRVTRLDKRGRIFEPISYAVSKSVASVRINEVVTSGGNEVMTNGEDERRIRLDRATQTIRYTADIEFLRVDPGVLSLVAGVPVNLNAAGVAVGFDSTSRLSPVAFGLEVWSKLAGRQCEGGEQAWGYTVFPFLKGGYLSGFTFANGLVSFDLIGAQTRKGPGWGVGPYDLEGPYERLTSLVSRNTSFRQFITPAAPPTEFDGIAQTTDVLDNGTPANPMPDPTAVLSVSGGSPADAGPFIIYGGRP